MLKARQMAFIIVGLPGIFIGLLFILTVKEPKRKGQRLNAHGEVEKSVLNPASVLLASTVKLLLAIIWVLHFMRWHCTV